jgi:hypothetical protein
VGPAQRANTDDYWFRQRWQLNERKVRYSAGFFDITIGISILVSHPKVYSIVFKIIAG